jgi:hypothetical protein
VAAEEFLAGFGVDIEGGVGLGVAGNGLDDQVCHVLGVVPVGLEPFLELGDLAGALDLDVQLDVLGEPRGGEVTGTNQGLGADDFELGVDDVCLGVELVAVVDAALDLA